MIRTVNEAVELAGRDGLLHLAIPGIAQNGSLAIPNAGFRMEPGSPGTADPPPRLDEHREEILRWLAEDETAGETTTKGDLG
jgi:CoA:oxalate CoA-transferase